MEKIELPYKKHQFAINWKTSDAWSVLISSFL